MTIRMASCRFTGRPIPGVIGSRGALQKEALRRLTDTRMCETTIGAARRRPFLFSSSKLTALLFGIDALNECRDLSL
jgi:hypothetical protein